MTTKNRQRIDKIISTIFYNNRIKATLKTPIFNVNKLCRLLKIDIPEEYIAVKNISVYETNLFDNLENKDELIAQIAIRNNFPFSFYYRLRIRSKEFKKTYYSAHDFKYNDTELLQLFVDWLYVFNPLGFNVSDYFNYELYQEEISKASTLIGITDRLRIREVCNDPKYRKYFDDKALFNKTYSDYIKRDWLDVTKSSFKNFKLFVKKHPEFLGKVKRGKCGENIEIFNLNNNTKQLYKECKKRRMLVEEIIKNNDLISDFNKTALNTIRICSLLTANNGVIITRVVMRFGREGEFIDNFHGGGLMVDVDPKTGIVISDGVTKNHKVLKKHPDSHKTFKGFQIPYWDEIIKEVKSAALIIPQIRHVGWDISVTDKNTIEFIEGNISPGFGTKREKTLYGKYIDELEQLKKDG